MRDNAIWMEEAMEQAARCWCDTKTADIEMDDRLANAVARRIAVWMETAAQSEQNTAYYRGLVVQCGEALGHAAYVQDDGGVVDEVLCAKVPQLVAELVARSGREAGDG